MAIRAEELHALFGKRDSVVIIIDIRYGEAVDRESFRGTTYFNTLYVNL